MILLNSILNVEKGLKDMIPDIVIALLGILSIILCFVYLKSKNKEFEKLTGIIRVIVALSCAAISIILPGSISIDNSDDNGNMLWTGIKASEAIAIFFIVYLFNPK